jgi:hypothetical protein
MHVALVTLFTLFLVPDDDMHTLSAGMDLQPTLFHDDSVEHMRPAEVSLPFLSFFLVF